MTAVPQAHPSAVDPAVTASWSAHLITFAPEDVERTALRHRSLAVREVLAHAATAGRLTYDELSAAVLAAPGTRPGPQVALDPVWGPSLALVVGVQDLLPTDTTLAVGLYALASAGTLGAGLPDRHRGALAELLLASDDPRRAAQVVEAAQEPGSQELRHLVLDVANPHVDAGRTAGRTGSSPTADAWAAGFAALFTEHDLAAPVVRPGTGPALDRLATGPVRTTGSGPLVSVVMTTYRPDETLLTSVRSVLAQSWTNLEVILVDDASPAEFGPLLDEVAELDVRLRVIRRTTNGGTYLARNDGLAAAGGLFVTGQDSDDWSHPQRVERQAVALLADEDRPGVRSHMLTVSPDLVLHRRGIPPRRISQISLMMPRDLALSVGGYVPARRSADVELAERLEAATRRGLRTLPEPLMLARIRADSLSRPDFRAGWHHPARLAMRSSWSAWHRRIREGASPLVGAERSVQVPRRYRIEPAPAPVLDVVLLADWRRDAPTLPRGLAMARALADAGLSTGLWQVDDPRDVRGGTPAPSRDAGDLVNDGAAELVVPDDPGSVGLLVVLDAALLELFPSTQVALEVDDALVLDAEPDHLPAPAGPDCERTLAALLGRATGPGDPPRPLRTRVLELLAHVEVPRTEDGEGLAP